MSWSTTSRAPTAGSTGPGCTPSHGGEGTERWSRGVTGANLPDALAVADGRVVTVSGAGLRGGFLADSTGTPTRTPTAELRGAVVDAFDAACGVHRWRVETGGGYATGEELWTAPGARGRSPPSVSNGVVFTGDTADRLRALDPA